MALLSIKNLKKKYRSPEDETEMVVLDVESFELQEGEQLALEGSSGSGKTTFLNLIAGILKANEGSLLFQGSDLVQLSEAKRDQIRAQSIGYIFQNFNLLQGFSALENVLLGMAFGQGMDTALAQNILQKVGLEKRLHYRPSQLSIGQQQRVALARALTNRPKLVLADEPTGNLDYHNAQSALKLLRDLCKEQGSALLLVSHDPEILQQFDQVKNIRDINRVALQQKKEV
jgi:ABC-type lipoprotein export system ATPase subunit